MPTRKTITLMLLWVATTMAARATLLTTLGDGPSNFVDLILMTAFLTPIWAIALGAVLAWPAFLLARALGKPRVGSGAAMTGPAVVMVGGLLVLVLIGSAFAIRGYPGKPTTPLDLVSLLSGFWPLGRFSIVLLIEAVGVVSIARWAAIKSLDDA